MDNQFDVVACPYCGGTRLTAYYDETADKKLARSGWFGVIGLIIGLFRTRNEQTTFWRCETCGNKFPMN